MAWHADEEETKIPVFCFLPKMSQNFGEEKRPWTCISYVAQQRNQEQHKTFIDLELPRVPESL